MTAQRRLLDEQYVTVSFRIPKSIHQGLKINALKKNQSMSLYIENAMKAALMFDRMKTKKK